MPQTPQETSGLWLALALAGTACCVCGCGSKPKTQATVTINGRTWRVEVAAGEQDRYRGLGGRRELAADAGMIFLFPHADVQQFCMRDCEFPIDVAFIDSDLRVVHVTTMEVEADRVGRAVYSSQVPARYALEVNAGALKAAGAKAGDKVSFSPDILEQTKEASDR
jgi:uncharacterized membrane protein (UPF0127 family)